MTALGLADLGATSFCASCHLGDKCGANGLPLTPNSICILGRFQRLTKMNHPRLCRYVDLQRDKHERVIVVSEYYKQNLARNISSNLNYDSLLQISYDILSGLTCLNAQGIVVRNLCPQNILFDCSGRVKLSAYGLFYMTGNGSYVSFPIGVPKYMAPEILCRGIKPPSSPRMDMLEPMQFDSEAITERAEHPRVDVWSLGLILLETAMGQLLWEGLNLRETFTKVFSLIKKDVHPFDALIKEFDHVDRLKVHIQKIPVSSLGLALPVITDVSSLALKQKLIWELPEEFRDFLRCCLSLMPSTRPSPCELMKLPLFTKISKSQVTPPVEPLEIFSTEVRCASVDITQSSNTSFTSADLLAERSIDEVYYLWKLAGGDLGATLRKAGVICTRPPITNIACLVVGDGEIMGEDRDIASLYDDTVIILSLDQLRQRFSEIDPVAYYPLLEDDMSGFDEEDGNTNKTQRHGSTGSRMSNSSGSIDLQESVQLPLVIREKDVEYQLHRVVLFEQLLTGYPYKKQKLFRECRTDIPPLYRALVWSTLLEIEGDVHGRYEVIDKESPTATDRQTKVDIPRCHQYNELLSSPTGHAKFKRLLKAWVVSHPEYVYWQGLDSMCAPFLYLNFNNEAVAFACLSAFIPKYLHKFFLKENAAVIQDAQLGTHLDDIGFIPDVSFSYPSMDGWDEKDPLYAIPWFLTMYAHVFPLHKIFHLWDTLLLGNSSFPLCIGVAILQQLRDQLLSFGFNECILLFSDMPEIDIERCVQDSIRIFCSTPRSVTYRQFAAPADLKKSRLSVPSVRPAHSSPEKYSHTELGMEPILLPELKSQKCPRISAEDLLDLTGLNLAKDFLDIKKKKKSARPGAICVIDVRPSDEFRRGSVPDSINIPFSTAFTGEGDLGVTPFLTQTLHPRRSQVKVIVGSSRGRQAFDFGEQLVRLGYNRVCILHKGIDVLRAAGVLTVPTPEL